MSSVTILHDFLIAAAAIWLSNVLALIPWRKTKGAHWAERARVLYPIRIASKVNLVQVPIIIVLARILFGDGPTPPWWLSLAAAGCGALAGCYPFDREISPWLKWSAWAREVILVQAMRLGYVAVVIGLWLMMPRAIDWQAWCVLALGAVCQAWYVWGGLLRLLRWLGLVRACPDHIRAMLKEVAQALNLSPPRLWVLRSSSVNAFALPHSGAILFTERCLEITPEEELAAIGAHEMGHLNESRLAKGIRFVGSMFFLPWLLLKPLYYTQAWVWAVVAFVLPILLLQGLLALGKRMERRADRIALGLQSDEGIYARALANIYEQGMLPAVLPGKNHVHPHLYDRLLAAGITPDFPRPLPPATWAWHGTLCLILMISLAALSWHAEFGDNPDRTSESRERFTADRDRNPLTHLSDLVFWR